MEKDLKYLNSLCNRTNSFGLINDNLLKKLDRIRSDIYVDEDHKMICADALEETPLWKTPEELTKMYGTTKKMTDKISFDVSENMLDEIIKNGKVTFTKKEFLINSYNNREETHKAFLKKHLCGVLENFKVDKEFVKSQNDYIKNLSLSELSVLNYYTIGGDRAMNSILSGDFDENWDIGEFKYDSEFISSMYFIIFEEIKDLEDLADNETRVKYIIDIFPTFSDEFVKKILNIAVNTLQKIIINSPKITKIMKVFRCVSNSQSKSILQGKENSYYTNKRFVSTSIDPNSSLRFANNRNKPVDKEGFPLYSMKVITLLPGSHGLFLAGVSGFYEEFELLLPFGSTYLVRSRKVCSEFVGDWCIHKKQNLFVEDIVILK
jgi:hypothetical protein